ncbi:hypothetical protein Taro_039981 [Colocasia esculenta]|uniref:GRF-type domain-containing protein n=1 Tax=Colocasia esculenta TaxID=4460 RepID=A0A843W7S8_COLES|nr:hypothetical protein [Colocasia esculenta]
MPFEEGGNGENLLAAALQTSIAPCVSAVKRRPAVWERCEEDTRVAVWLHKIAGYREIINLAMASAGSCSMTIPSLRCPCGYGWCDRFTSHTTNNPNRKYYKCKKESCKFFMWCDEFLALGRSSIAKCECDEVMQKLVEDNEILRKRVQELQLQLEKKTRITASLGRVISTLTTEEADN